MEIRLDFITNSSSTSYVLLGYPLDVSIVEKSKLNAHLCYIMYLSYSKYEIEFCPEKELLLAVVILDVLEKCTSLDFVHKINNIIYIGKTAQEIEELDLTLPEAANLIRSLIKQELELSLDMKEIKILTGSTYTDSGMRLKYTEDEY